MEMNNEFWHTLASAGAFVSASLVGVLHHLYTSRLARMEKAHEDFEDDITKIRERLATLEERSRWNGQTERRRDR
jgi:hypothetical protein